MADPTLTEQLAAWIVRWRARGLPPDALSTARTYVLDWLGAALAGRATEPGRMLLAYADSQPPGPCSVAGAGRGRPAEVAALVNGALSHIVETDDLDRASVVHPGAVVIPSSLAAAEAQEVTGPAFLSAVVIGYEVASRVGAAVGKAHYRYFHNTSTCGVFGAAAAAGWLLDLGEEQLVWALGNAGTQSAGLWEFNADGSMSKHLHPGRAAASGLLSAELAARGFTGAPAILEGERGLFAATAPDASPGRVVEDLPPLPDDDARASSGRRSSAAPSRFRIHGVSLKPWPSCRHTHAPVGAALALREELLGIDGVEAPGGTSGEPDGVIESADDGIGSADDGPGRPGAAPADVAQEVEVETYGAALDLCDDPDPRTPYEAKFSLQYCIASALLRGRVGLEEFTPPRIRDAGVRTLMPRIRCRAEPGIEARYPAEWPAVVRVHLHDGRSCAASVDAPKGDPENPLGPEEVEAKFRRLAAYGDRSEHAQNYLDWVRSLTRLDTDALSTAGLEPRPATTPTGSRD